MYLSIYPFIYLSIYLSLSLSLYIYIKAFLWFIATCNACYFMAQCMFSHAPHGFLYLMFNKLNFNRTQMYIKH